MSLYFLQCKKKKNHYFYIICIKYIMYTNILPVT